MKGNPLRSRQCELANWPEPPRRDVDTIRFWREHSRWPPRRAPAMATAPTHACPSGTPSSGTVARSTSPGRSPAPAGFSRQPAGGLCRDQSSHRRAASQGPRPTRQHAGSNAGSLRYEGQCATPHTSSDCGILHELVAAAHGEACACHPAPGRTTYESPSLRTHRAEKVADCLSDCCPIQ